MRFEGYNFGSLTVDGVTYHTDVVIDRGAIRKRHKKASKKYRDEYGHTPLSAEEEIPWQCRQLVIGTGAMGELPVVDAVREEARRRKVKLIVLPTGEAIQYLKQKPAGTNAVLHLTC
jgi:hypothetical protein